MDKKTPQLMHIGIATDNLEESLAFYERALGLKADKREILRERGIEVAFLTLANTTLEIMAPISDTSEISAFLAKRGPGIHHIAIEENALERRFNQLTTQNIPLATHTIQIGAGGHKVLFIHPKASKGVLIELTNKHDAK